MPAPAEPPVAPPNYSPEPVGPSPAFNSMQDKLKNFMAPFVEKKGIEEVPNTAPVPTPEPENKQEAQQPAEAPKPPDEEFPESIRKSPKASEEFKKIKDSERKFKADAEKYSSQIKSIEAEMAKLKAAATKPAMPPEFESLKKEHAELSDQLKITSIERHPEFRKHYESRTNAAVEKAKAVLGDDLTSKATKLASSPANEYRAEQLDKMITELQDSSPSKAVFLTDLIRDINSISFDRENALKKARDDYDILQRHEAEKASNAKAEEARNIETFIASVWEATTELEAFKTVEDPKANEGVEQRKALMKSWMSGEKEFLPTHKVPGMAMEAVYLKETLLPQLKEENAKLLKQISEMTQATPRPGETNGKTEAITPRSGNSFMEKYLANKPKV